MQVKITIKFNYIKHRLFRSSLRIETILENAMNIPNEIFDDIKNKRLNCLMLYPPLSISSIFIIWSALEHRYILWSSQYFDDLEKYNEKIQYLKALDWKESEIIY